MKSNTVFDIVSFLLGLFVTGEVLALLIGMYFLEDKSNPWISPRNFLLLGIDLVCGLILIATVWIYPAPTKSLFVMILTGITIVAHGYRYWEFLVHLPNRFCFNTPLWVVTI
jgi:hypothetical protein